MAFLVAGPPASRAWIPSLPVGSSLGLSQFLYPRLQGELCTGGRTWVWSSLQGLPPKLGCCLAGGCQGSGGQGPQAHWVCSYPRLNATLAKEDAGLTAAPGGRLTPSGSALPGEVMGKTCRRGAPSSGSPKTPTGLAWLLPAVERVPQLQGQPSPGLLVRCPRSPGPKAPVMGADLGAFPGSQTPQARGY